MPGPRTLDDMARNDANIREVAETTRDISRHVHDVELQVRGVEVELRGTNHTLTTISTQIFSDEKRIRTVEERVTKLFAWAVILGVGLSILATQIVRYVMEAKPPEKLTERYRNDAEIEALRRDLEAYRKTKDHE